MKGAVIAVIIALAGIGVGIYSFVANTTPYVTAKEASAMPGEYVHVAGKILHETAQYDIANSLFRFEIVDDQGDKLRVIYKGQKPGNFDSAPKASIAGRFMDGAFQADEIKTQCPSKYETDSTYNSK